MSAAADRSANAGRRRWRKPSTDLMSTLSTYPAPLAAGAIFQEAIDVAVILNALRALRG